MQLSSAHLNLLQDIYSRIDEVQFSEHGLQEIEYLLGQATHIAECYGTEEGKNSLLNDLLQTRQKQLAETVSFLKDHSRFGPAMRSLQQNFKWDISSYLPA